MEQELQKLTQAILARGELLKQLQIQCAAIQASVEEMKPIRPEVKTETKPAAPVVSDPLLRAEVPQSVTPPAQASSSRSLATGELNNLIPARCSKMCSGDDTASQKSALMPDAALGPPSTAAPLDVVITSIEPIVDALLVQDGTYVLTSTPSGATFHSIDVGDKKVPKLCCCQLGARKVFDEMPTRSTVVLWPPLMKWDERQPWPPPSRVVLKCSGGGLRPTPWPSFSCNRVGLQLKTPWPSLMGCGVELNKRGMSIEEKNMLRVGLESLPEEKMHNVLQIVWKRNGNPELLGNEIELNIDEMDVETQGELDRFVNNFKKALNKSRRAANVKGDTAEVNNAAVAEDVNGGVPTLVDNGDAESENPEKRTIVDKQVDECVDIGDEMPTAKYQSVEIEKDAEVASGSGGSGGGSSSSPERTPLRRFQLMNELCYKKVMAAAGGWRYMFGFGAPLVTIMAIGMWTLPPSPRWLLLRAVQGKGSVEDNKKKAIYALRRLRGRSASDNVLADEIDDTLVSMKAAYAERQSEGNIWGIFEGVPVLKTECNEFLAKNAASIEPDEPFYPHFVEHQKISFSASAKKNKGKGKRPLKDSGCSMRSPLLNCSWCGATVRIWDFRFVPRPSCFSPNSIDASAASGINEGVTDGMERDHAEGRDEAANEESKLRVVLVSVSHPLVEQLTNGVPNTEAAVEVPVLKDTLNVENEVPAVGKEVHPPLEQTSVIVTEIPSPVKETRILKQVPVPLHEAPAILTESPPLKDTPAITIEQLPPVKENTATLKESPIEETPPKEAVTLSDSGTRMSFPPVIAQNVQSQNADGIAKKSTTRELAVENHDSTANVNDSISLVASYPAPNARHGENVMNKGSGSSDKTLVNAASSFQFFVIADEGLDLFVDLNSTPSDWVDSLKEEVCIPPGTHHSEPGNFSSFISSLASKDHHNTISPCGNIIVDKQNGGAEGIAPCTNSSLGSTGGENSRSEPYPPDTTAVNSLSSASTLPGTLVEISGSQEGVPVVSSCLTSNVQNNMSSDMMADALNNKVLPQESVDVSVWSERSNASLADDIIQPTGNKDTVSAGKTKVSVKIGCTQNVLVADTDKAAAFSSGDVVKSDPGNSCPTSMEKQEMIDVPAGAQLTHNGDTHEVLMENEPAEAVPTEEDLGYGDRLSISSGDVLPVKDAQSDTSSADRCVAGNFDLTDPTPSSAASDNAINPLTSKHGAESAQSHDSADEKSLCDPEELEELQSKTQPASGEPTRNILLSLRSASARQIKPATLPRRSARLVPKESL